MDRERFKYLGYIIGKNEASNEEKLEYMTMLHNDGSITDKQYENYKNGLLKEDILKVGLAVGAGLLLGWAISQLIKD